MRFLVLGGGCYGSFYARQLVRARAAGAIESEAEIVVVDRDSGCRATREADIAGRFTQAVETWDDFFDYTLEQLDPDTPDLVVAPPFTPHLGLAWLLRRLRRERPGREWTLEDFRRFPGTPFQRQTAGGPLVLSHADWVCPVHCIEPATCPHTRGPRTWEMDATVRQLARSLAGDGQTVDGTVLLHCHHVTHGVGAYPLAALVRGYLEMASIPHDADVRRHLVATISHCHGAAHLVRSVHGTERVSTAARVSMSEPQPRAP